jgi:predicted cytidylate kinase
MCSGKSSIASEIVGRLPGWRLVNTGQVFRDICNQRGWTIQDVAALPDETHQEVDEFQRQQIKNGDRLVVEGRLAGWMARDLPDVYRVFCEAPLEVRIRRFMEREKREPLEAAADIGHRDQGDIQKYARLYGISDYRSPEFYTLRIDTSSTSPGELAGQIIILAGAGAVQT